MATTVMEQLTSSPRGIGVDVELIASFPMENETFIERNFTEKEGGVLPFATRSTSIFCWQVVRQRSHCEGALKR